MTFRDASVFDTYIVRRSGDEPDAVRAPEIAHERGHLTAGETVDAIEVQLLGRVLVLPYQPEWRIREVERPAGAEREVVRTVQTLAVEAIHDDGRLTVGADADDLAVEVLRHQHGAAVFGQQAIGADVRPGRRGRVSCRVLDQHLHLSGRRNRSQHVSDDIAEPEPSLRWTPQGTFGELKPAGDFLDGGIGRDDGIERRVEPDDGAGGGRRGRRRSTLWGVGPAAATQSGSEGKHSGTGTDGYGLLHGQVRVMGRNYISSYNTTG